MTTKAYTPGPWVAQTETTRIKVDSEHFTIAHVTGVDTEATANARLIAAAPDLLASAKKSLLWMIAERDCYYEGCEVMSTGEVPDAGDRETLQLYDRDIDALRALIERAEGVQP